MEHSFNLKKTLKYDYATLLTVLMTLMNFFIIVFFSVGTGEYHLIDWKTLITLGFPECFMTSDFLVLGIFLFFFLLSLILFKLRLNYIKSFGDEYIRVKGEVIYFYRSRNGYSISVKYSYKNQEYKKGFAFLKTKDTGMKKGSEITLLIKEENPKRAIVMDFYFD